MNQAMGKRKSLTPIFIAHSADDHVVGLRAAEALRECWCTGFGIDPGSADVTQGRDAGQTRRQTLVADDLLRRQRGQRPELPRATRIRTRLVRRCSRAIQCSRRARCLEHDLVLLCPTPAQDEEHPRRTKNQSVQISVAEQLRLKAS
jgi:hypothetical protein